MIDHDLKYGSKNLLKGKKLVALTPLDEDYNDISILTDGQLGLPHNYHCGQMQSSSQALRIGVPRESGMKRIRVSFTRNNIFRIGLPEHVQLSAGGREIGNAVPTASAENPNRASVEFTIPSSAAGDLVLTITRNQQFKTMAIDEVEGF